KFSETGFTKLHYSPIMAVFSGDFTNYFSVICSNKEAAAQPTRSRFKCRPGKTLLKPGQVAQIPSGWYLRNFVSSAT
ncbi:MAG: hypothetical protein ACRC3B_13305, partial [Bacteroidia bacterium]